jgi:ribosome recycling factor
MESLAAIVKDCGHKMDVTIEHLRNEFAHVRTGRATTALLDGIKVDYYGTPTPLNQVASVSTPDSRLLTVQPWEKNLIGDIERAILESDLGLNPQNDGSLIRLPIPELSEERRKELVKVLKRQAEDARIAVRNVRRDSNDNIKRFSKDNQVSEDEEHATHDEIQTLTDKHVELIDKLLEDKEKEVMTV